MSATPMIDEFLSQCAKALPDDVMRLQKPTIDSFAAELRALLAERDRLAALREAFHMEEERRALAEKRKAQPRPAPSYKGVTYRDGAWVSVGGLNARYENIYGALYHLIGDATEEDRLALLQLKADAEREPEKLEAVIERGYKKWRDVDPMGSTVRYVADEIRAAFPHIEQGPRVEGFTADANGSIREYFGKHPNATRADDLTAAECVARLRDGGATFWRVATAYADGADKPQRAICAPVLVLTTAQATEAA